MSRIFIFICFILFTSFVIAQEKPPLLKGRYQDTVCNAVPDTMGYFQIRTIYYGEWDTDTQSGIWDYKQVVYSSSECTDANKLYEMIYTGSYQLTGKKSEHVEDFWNINYRYDSKDIRVFSAQFQNMIADATDCGIGLVVLGRLTDIEEDSCALLKEQPSRMCPISYDIIRKQDARIWLGLHFSGNPIHYMTNCQSEDRLRDYDHFGLGILDLYAYEDVGVGVSPYETSLNDRLDIDGLFDYSSSSSLIISLTFIMSIILLHI